MYHFLEIIKGFIILHIFTPGLSLAPGLELTLGYTVHTALLLALLTLVMNT